MPWSVAAAVAGAAVTSAMAPDAPSGNTTSTNKVEIDPQMRAILYGSGRRLKDGVAATYGPGTAGGQKWVAGGVDSVGRDVDGHYETIADTRGGPINPESDYINDTGLLGRITGFLDQGQKPGMSTFGAGIDGYLGNSGGDNFILSQQAAQSLQNSHIQSPQINAPSQNDLNLSPAYQDMVYGAPGGNPYLTGAIQKGINQSNNAFGDYLTDATKATQDILGSIRGGAIVNGHMGGSRQGIAEGRAIGDLTQNLGRAATRFGQNNTDAAVAARAGAYDADRNRSLSAMSGLGAQQYGVASQNAQLEQQTNQLNSANKATGIGLSSGLLGQAYGYGANSDAYDLNKVGKVSGLLTPFTGLGGSTTNSSPLYTNTAGNILGGATAGLGLYDAYKKSGLGSSDMNNQIINPYTYGDNYG